MLDFTKHFNTYISYFCHYYMIVIFFILQMKRSVAKVSDGSAWVTEAGQTDLFLFFYYFTFFFFLNLLLAFLKCNIHSYKIEH